MTTSPQRYTAVAIVLHWAIAVAIVFMIPLGFWMHIQAKEGVITDDVFRAFQLHKSVGLTVLTLTLVRLAWRLMNPPPPMPAHMPGWERFIAKATHWAFYALTLGLPLSGWLYVSSGWSIHDEQPLMVTTHWFGLIQVPALFGLPQADIEVREAAAEAAFTAHWVLAYSAIGLAVLHVGAALKHHFFDRDEVLAHMVPGLSAPFETEPRPKQPLRLAVLGAGLGLATIAAAALLFAVANLGTPAGAPQTESNIEITEQQPEAFPSAPATVAPGSTEVTPAAPGAASAWTVDPRASSIGFSFTYDDGTSGATRFDGRFTRWRADIRFDDANLDQSSAVVTIESGSATDGVEIHDRSLPSPEWFDAAGHPTAVFRTTSIRREGSGYEARGRLTIKGRERNVTLPFTLVIAGDRATMTGRTTIDRHDFEIGEDTEADELISREVQLSIRVEAVRAP